MNVQDVLPRDAIPSIDEPEFGPDHFGGPDDEVIVVEGTPPRAYPIRILSYHEIVNDVLDGGGSRPAPRRGAGDAPDGRPIAVTWCPICWSAAVYDRRVGGRTLTFGVSGKLADDALVMYDRETGSGWKQPSGECIAGELAGRTLEALAAPLVTWREFRSSHPEGVVLQPVRGGGPGNPSPDEAYDMDRYEAYAESGPFGLYGMRGTGEQRTWDREDLDPKTVVLGVERGGEAVGYPIPRVEAAGGVVADTVGGLDVVVVAPDGGIHAFEDPGFAFERRDGTLRGDGATWNAATGRSDDGRRLTRVPARPMFAFAWQDEHGPDAFYSP